MCRKFVLVAHESQSFWDNFFDRLGKKDGIVWGLIFGWMVRIFQAFRHKLLGLIVTIYALFESKFCWVCK